MIGDTVKFKNYLDEISTAKIVGIFSDKYEDIKIDENIIKFQVDTYRRIRNTLRFLIGNLKNYDDKEKISYEKLLKNFEIADVQYI